MKYRYHYYTCTQEDTLPCVQGKLARVITAVPSAPVVVEPPGAVGRAGAAATAWKPLGAVVVTVAAREALGAVVTVAAKEPLGVTVVTVATGEPLGAVVVTVAAREPLGAVVVTVAAWETAAE